MRFVTLFSKPTSANRPNTNLACERLEERCIPSVGGGFTDGGIKGSYYANASFSGQPTFIRTDVRLNFDWGSGKPGGSNSPNYAGVGADSFSVKWEGVLLPQFNEVYSFRASTDLDDTFKLFVREVNLASLPSDYGNWNPADSQSLPMALASTSGTIKDYVGSFGKMTVDPLKQYQVQIRYTENSAGAAFKLQWASPSTPEEVIDPVTDIGYNVPVVSNYDESYYLADALRSGRWWFGPPPDPVYSRSQRWGNHASGRCGLERMAARGFQQLPHGESDRRRRSIPR